MMLGMLGFAVLWLAEMPLQPRGGVVGAKTRDLPPGLRRPRCS